MGLKLALVALLGACGGTPSRPVPAPPPATPTIEVRLVTTHTGTQRVNFALPLPAGAQADDNVAVLAAGRTLASARRVLATHPDGSARSIQIQADVDVGAHRALALQLGTASPTLALVPVADTLAGSGNDVTPKVFALLPPEILATSGVAGPLAPRAQGAWAPLCDYARWGTDAFLAKASNRDAWLFDRVTALYRGYAITGELAPLRSAYREAAIYQAGMTIADGVATTIAVPNAQTDLKYHYAQGMALHYLLTGDDRYREAAAAISAKVVTLWDPRYDGTDKFWTERHAGFALLAHEWAAIVGDPAAPARAEAVVTAALAMQRDAGCFAHTAAAHGEDWGGVGCSPWMSAILADGLDAHARRVGGDRAVAVRDSLARLGRALASEGRDVNGRPLYWMGVGTSADRVDEYDEHWGESAYVVALAWDATGRRDDALAATAASLVRGLREHGTVGHVRSFNWQCRSAVMTPALLR